MITFELAIGCRGMSGLPRIGLPLAALLSAALAACGASEGNSAEDKNAYVERINAAQRTYSVTVTNVKRSVTPKSTPRQDQRTIENFRAAIADIIENLQTIKVPSDVRGEHALLVAAMNGFGKDIARVATTLRRQTSQAVVEVQRMLGAATITVNTKLATAREAINRRLGST